MAALFGPALPILSPSLLPAAYARRVVPLLLTLPPSCVLLQERFQKFTRDRTDRLSKYETEREGRLQVHENHKKEVRHQTTRHMRSRNSALCCLRLTAPQP